MGQPSFQASNAIIYLTYGAFLYGASLVRLLPPLNSSVGLWDSMPRGIGDINPKQNFWLLLGRRRVRFERDYWTRSFFDRFTVADEQARLGLTYI